MPEAPRCEASGDDTLLWVKVVPGASRTAIAGTLGERLKVRVASPPEQGRANAALCAFLAKQLGLRAADVSVAGGSTSPEKVVRIAGCAPERVRSLWD